MTEYDIVDGESDADDLVWFDVPADVGTADESDPLSDLERLAQPFPDTLIRQVPTGGGDMDYVPWYTEAQRLLAFLGTYDWFIRHTGTPSGDDKEPFYCVGELTVHVDGRRVSVAGAGQGSDMKNAESDAFSRAASKFDGGKLALYDDGYWLDKQLAKQRAP